ncbi:hypothetical protein NK718_12810 [Alsobacter sp. SYSU M60028]|uniref:Uncharacterized protein n=1 Tax=Alsobacter ponti TaxID=2962936 RepID=A0ABT1LER4_9HYPH|nr:hypothetical protein [Alsobacter ponti]MCP8939398.1 hypothetical protein [Alsobacter ponti]
MSEPCILGIDPGVSGGIAFYFPGHPAQIAAFDMPAAASAVDPVTLAARVRQFAPSVAIVERVGAMPGQGVSSTFKFGTAFGAVIGVLAAMQVPTHLAAPGRWKKHFGLGADKDQSRALALRLWPSSDAFARKMDHNRAEAALLARFAAETGIGGAYG